MIVFRSVSAIVANFIDTFSPLLRFDPKTVVPDNFLPLPNFSNTTNTRGTDPVKPVVGRRVANYVSSNLTNRRPHCRGEATNHSLFAAPGIYEMAKSNAGYGGHTFSAYTGNAHENTGM